MKVTCPKCGKQVQISDGLANTKVLCPYCRVTLTLTIPLQKTPTVQCDLCKIDRPANQIQAIDSGEKLCVSCVHELRGGALKTPPPDSEVHSSPKQGVLAGSTSKQRKAQTKPTCQQCGGPMNKKTLSTGNCSGILLALIVFFAGLFGVNT